MADENFVKIAFELQQDDDGYPPDRYETLWAVALEESGLYRIDNIPLYVKGISSEDVVMAEPQEGRLQFVRLVRPSGNSVFRLYVADESDVQSARDSFRALGCESEQSYASQTVRAGDTGQHGDGTDRCAPRGRRSEWPLGVRGGGSSS